MPLSLTSSAYDIVADLVRHGMTAKIRRATPRCLDAAKRAAQAHVFHFNTILDMLPPDKLAELNANAKQFL